VQIHEPDPGPPGATWVASDHVEIWTTSFDPEMHNRANPTLVKQIGIGLDGAVHRGVGNPVPPKIRRWQGRDDSGRPVIVMMLRWSKQDALAPGVAVAYSQAANGRQARLIATTGIAKGRSLYLPSLQFIPVRCGLANGRWDVIANTGAAVR
jgi:hypothetical protein